MKVAINMEMPKECNACPFFYQTHDEDDDFVCKCQMLDNETIDGFTDKYYHCPLFPVYEGNEQEIIMQAIKTIEVQIMDALSKEVTNLRHSEETFKNRGNQSLVEHFYDQRTEATKIKDLITGIIDKMKEGTQNVN